MYLDIIDVLRGRGAAATNEIAIKATELFRMFTKRELTKQWRAEEKVHNERIRHMREDDVPLTEERLKTIRPLTRADARSERWMFAPVLVAANRDRHRINFIKAKLWGKVKNKPVLVPCAIIRGDVSSHANQRHAPIGRPHVRTRQIDLSHTAWYDRFRGDGDETGVLSWRYSRQYEKEYPLLKRFFVQDAPAMLTHSDAVVLAPVSNGTVVLVSASVHIPSRVCTPSAPLQNINPSKGLANGTTKGVTLHSLTWATPEE